MSSPAGESTTLPEIDESALEVDRPALVAGPWYPPPTHPPPRTRASGRTDRRAIGSLVTAVAGIVLGLPLGVPGMVLGTLAYFLGKSALNRIDGSPGVLGGRSLAVSGWVLGAVAMAIGSAVTLAWIVFVLVANSQPTA